MAAAFPILRPLALGVAGIVALVFGLAAWSATVPLAGAVIAMGSVTLEGDRRPVQHPEGGTLAAVFVAEGDRVVAGSRLLRFDDRLLRTERAVIAGQLAELAARRARLEAERDGAVAMPPPPAGSPASGPAAEAFDGQARLFAARRAALEGRVGQLEEQIIQARAEIEGTGARAAALRFERALVAEEAEDQQALLDRGLTQRTRVTGLRREIARIDGDLGEISARTARLRAEIAETRLAVIALVDDRREAAIAELRDIAAREAETLERARSLDGTLARLDVRAPVDGVVLGLRVAAAGAVVRPAEVMLDLVPDGARLIVEVRVRATDRDAVRPGQPARLRFPGRDGARLTETAAQVLRISPDVLVDEASGAAYYVAAIGLGPDAAERLELVPGMPTEAFVETGERTALAYLIGPLSDYFARAHHEG